MKEFDLCLIGCSVPKGCKCSLISQRSLLQTLSPLKVNTLCGDIAEVCDSQDAEPVFSFSISIWVKLKYVPLQRALIYVAAM